MDELMVEIALNQSLRSIAEKIAYEHNNRIRSNWKDGFNCGYSQALHDIAKKLNLEEFYKEDLVKQISKYSSKQFVRCSKSNQIHKEMIRSIVHFLLCVSGFEYSISIANVTKMLTAILEELSEENNVVRRYSDSKHALCFEFDNKFINNYFYDNPIDWEDSWLREVSLKHRNAQKQFKYSRRGVSGTVRQNVFMRDKYACQICGATVKDGAKLELDHIKPISKGGTNNENNLQVLCQQCNREKHNREDLLHDKMKLVELGVDMNEY